MKALKQDLQGLRKSLISLTQQTEKIAMQSVIKSLRSLTQQADKMTKRLDRLEKSISKTPAKAAPKKKAAAKKPAAKKAKKKVTATDTVLSMIKRSKNGVDTATLRKKTGYDRNKIQVIIYRLKKQGKIKTADRGVYVEA
ncbi:MAG: hypothetical protein GY849_22420 [Deltaproteobacteria bacterium]|nr:hypothetical protein [Deltaproteobacteria bacterium]